jgi:hypothetical protein
MALRAAVATGNWSNPAIWNDGVLPTVGDIVASNNFTITIDQNINVELITNTVQSPVIITPAMTSNTTPSGIVSASSYFSNISTFLPWRAFDRGTNTNWLSNGTTGWLAYEFPTSKTVTRYQVLTPSDGSPTSVPRNWTFEGWDGTNWIVLDTVTGNSGTAIVNRTLANTTAYIQYRINITLNNGNGAYTGVTELYLYEANDYGANSVAGGGFVLNDSYTVTANLLGGAVNLLTYSGSTSATIIGNLTHGTGNNVVNFNSSTGTLNIVGNVINNGTAGRGILVTNTGTLSIVGDVYITGGNYLNSLLVQANGTVNITGNVYNSADAVFASSVQIALNSICTLNIVGNLTHRSNNATNGILISINAADCTVNITGNVLGGRQPQQQAISSGQRHYLNIIGTILSDILSVGPSVSSGNGSAINLFTGPFICSPYGFFPYQVVRMHLIPTTNSYIEFRDETTNGALSPGAIAPATRLVSPATIADNPIPANVRFGTVYSIGSQTGTLRMPHPNQVTYGVAVDNTFGNAVLTAASVWDYLVASITVENSIGMRLKNVATPQSVGEQLEAFLRLE